MFTYKKEMLLPSLLDLSPGMGADHLPLRASDEHILIVRVPRARKIILSIVWRLCVIVVFFAVDRAEAFLMKQRCGVGNHGAVSAKIDGQILD
jgi:hypothetical protein